jgi:hypothetical protein
MDEEPTPAAAHRFRLALPSQRFLQVLLGVFWILDAALQFQPYMFGQNFVPSFILANASGQPAFLGAFITHIGHFVSPDVAVWNTFFALTQLAIGVGLLARRTVRPALVLSFVWALGVWVVGEGLGMLLTGTATALTGAPGSVLLYGLLGLMAWPRRQRHDSRLGGIASSSAARGIGGVRTPLAVWTGYWSLAAVLFVLPDNRTTTSISSAIVGMTSGQPRWYAHFLTSVGNQFHTTGAETAWVLAVVCLVIAVGPLVTRRPGLFLAGGALVAVAFWVTGQGLVGNLFTGSATDPNTGPLIVLLAVAMVPMVDARRTATTPPPVVSLIRWSPAAAALGSAAVAAAMALSATYPVAAAESTSAAMSGMVMAGHGATSAPSTSTSTSTCVNHQSGLAISGLDLNNTPYMIMSGHLGMDMNGADASAAAGLNTTETNWHYTGPALPSALARELLTDGNNGPADIHMAESGCAASVTASQQIKAERYVQATSQAVARLANPFEAVAAGYVAVSPMNYPVVYYVNPTIAAANAASRRALNPNAVDGLVFAQTPSGAEVLVAAMYLLPSTVGRAPLPYGALVQWHRRTAVCASTGPGFDTGPLSITGFPPCASGSSTTPTPYMSMVWQVPVAGGPLAIQPPDIQIVEAAIMGSDASS